MARRPDAQTREIISVHQNNNVTEEKYTKQHIHHKISMYLRVYEGWRWLTIKQLLTNSRNTRWKHGHARTN